MSEQAVIQDEYLPLARQLVQALEAGDQGGADALLDELAELRETGLFQQLGRLTRDLHETLKAFQTDPRVTTLAEEEIPDARERLSYVITMTEQAAHRTLNAVEDSLVLNRELGERAGVIRDNWQRFRRRELSAAEFRELSRDIDGFLGETQVAVERLGGHLNEALMAQDFQDLSGQIIRRVIELVGEVEARLVELVSLTGRRRGDKAAAPAAVEQEAASLEGPQLPGRESDTAVRDQDEVDDLLSSLGF